MLRYLLVPRVSITLNFGHLAPPGALSDALSALTVVCDASETVADLEAQRSAEVQLLRDVARNPASVLNRARLNDSAGPDAFEDINEWIDDLRWESEWLYRWTREWGPPPPPWRRPFKGLPPSLFTLSDLSTRSMPPAVQQLISADAARLLGDDIGVESLNYSNPLVTTLIAGGLTFSSLIVLLGVVRDFGARRRISNAAAGDAEDTARARRQLRRQLLSAHARGEIAVPPAELMAALGDPPVDAMAKLMRLDPQVEQLEDHDDSNQ